MIDWSTSRFPLIHEPISTGKLTKTDSDGAVLWESQDLVRISGSYEKGMSVKSVGGDGHGRATHLWVSGNPSKFLQGHNVFGSDDLLSLNYDTYVFICNALGLNPTSQELEKVRSGLYEINRTDINYSFILPSQGDVLSWLRAAELKGSTRMGRARSSKGSIYFGFTSEYYKQVFYSKSLEIQSKTGKLPNQLQDLGIENWVENILRAELRLLTKEARRLDIVTAKDLVEYGVTKLFHDYMGRVEMPEQIELSDEKLIELPRKLRLTYKSWLRGDNLREDLSEPTFYRHKKELKQFGINIDLKPESLKKTNVVPLIRILEAKPAEIPQFAFDDNLVHHSASNF